MHPAYSVILFTCASGAGYGLLVWLCLLGVAGAIPTTPAFGFAGLGVATALIAAGLLSSTSHLGRPERAWRAFSEWRSSWLSREGVAAMATFVPLLVLAAGWIGGVVGGAGAGPGVIPGSGAGWTAPFGFVAVLTALFALVTIACTGMIYQSLPTIRAWHQPTVTPVYLALGLGAGAAPLVALLAMFDAAGTGHAAMAIAALLVAWSLKAVYWRDINRAPREWTIGDATGLGRYGTVRPLDPPHTQPNYVMREMGYAVARKHAESLRRIAVWLGLAVPVAALLLLVVTGTGFGAVPLTLLAALSALVGTAVERWLFFAEAQHVVMLYYGRQEA